MKGCIKNVTWMIVSILAAMSVEQTSYGMEKPDINNRLVIVNKSSWDIDVTNPEIGVIKSGDRYVLDKIPRQITFSADGSFLARFARRYTMNIAEQPDLYHIKNDIDVVLKIAAESSWIPVSKPWKTSIIKQPRWKTITSQAAIPFVEEQLKASSKEGQMFAVFKERPRNRNDLENKTKSLFKFDLRGFRLPFEFVISMIDYQGKCTKLIDKEDCWYVQPYYIINPRLHKYIENKGSGNIERGLKEHPRFVDDVIDTAIKTYKIHLMPKTRDIPRYYSEIVKMMINDKSFRSGIHAFKANVMYPESFYKICGGLPKIVIYVYGKDNAQKVLNKIYDKFKDEKGSGQIPGFNEKVTDLIFFAQGHRDAKLEGEPDFYEEPEKVYYDPEKLKRKYKGLVRTKKKDFHLENPAQKK